MKYLISSLALTILLSSITLAQITISGAQSDTLDAGEYIVEDDIWVDAGNVWYLRPGVVLRFMDGAECRITGSLQSYGIEGDSVYFEAYDESSHWKGIDLLPTNSGSRFLYTVITGSNDNGIQSSWGSSRLRIYHCRLSNNSDDDGDGGGIFSASAFEDTLSFVTVSNNIGSGIYFESSHAIIHECRICYNSGFGLYLRSGYINVNGCKINGNQNTGMYLFVNTFSEIDSSEICYNTGLNGGGVYCAGFTDINHSLIKGNFALNHGGAGYSSSSFGGVTFSNCVLTENSADSLGNAIYALHALVVNSAIFNNFGCETTLFAVADDLAPFYNVFFSNQGSDYFSEYPYIHVGEIDTVNNNGHPSDIYYNIFTDPLMVDPENGDYHLTANSPCIDAGHPDSTYDNDGTIRDIGLYYFDQNSSILDQFLNTKPEQFRIDKVYPNPFNSSVRISLFVPDAQQQVYYSVYDILGRLVDSGCQQFSYGNNIISWSAPTKLASGFYIIQIKEGQSTATRKIQLIR